MIRILDWLKERRITDRRSFSTSLESKDRGLHYRAVIRYRWRLNLDSPAPRPLAPDALARYLLREELGSLARTYPLLQPDAAEDAMNAALSQELWDQEKRLQVEGRVRIRVSKSIREAAQQRAEGELTLRSAHARETVELDLLLERLTDPTLGLVWWVSRYADLQFAAGDPKEKVASILSAFKQLRETLHTAKIDQTADEKLLVRRKIEEVFSVVEDEESLSLALQVMNRTLDHLGVNSSGQNTQDGPSSA
ncbi:hypothetical protein ACP4TB_24665 [Streptomyces sp. DR3-1]|uniref:hypothetical protein n=1 Tax=Streptomyces sp. DR3-1 TaxID=2951169 RepID=UPI00204361CA|nr:hypothetical protein [Streptomyces sp. DR3-1]MCM3821470.1 hypothetical protein [Streptomyces sp. DR3-1]